MALPKALIFDVDGTLADTERDGHRVAFNQAFRDAGLNWYWDEAAYGRLLAISGGQERMHAYLRTNPVNINIDKEIDIFIQEIHAAKNRHYDAMLKTGKIGLRPGIKRLISAARQAGSRLAIATTSVRDNVNALLSALFAEDAPDWFEVIASADEVADKKPSPAVYYYVLDQLGLGSSECLVFEDSQHGLMASRALGLATIITVNDYTRQQDFSGALLVVDHLGEPGKPMHVLGGLAAAKVDNRADMVDLAVIDELFG